MYLRDYEISLWQRIYSANQYSESKVVTLGSSGMNSGMRATNPVLTSNINGTHKFTFTLYKNWFNPLDNLYETNIGTELINNDSIIKLKVKNNLTNQYDWFDLKVTAIEESTDGKLVNYTCEDLFIDELAHNGYSLEFSDALYNNYGTITSLAERVLDGTSWSCDSENSDIQWNTADIDIYEIVQQVTVTKQFDKNKNTVYPLVNPTTYDVVKFYLFADEVNSNADNVVCIIPPANGFVYDDDKIIVNGIQCTVPNTATLKNANKTWYGRAKKYILRSSSHVDELNQRVVQDYRKFGDVTQKLYYGFTKTEFSAPESTTNLIVNPYDFLSTTGWYLKRVHNDSALNLEFVDYHDGQPDQIYVSAIDLHCNEGDKIRNTAFIANRGKFTDGLREGQKFHLVYRVAVNEEDPELDNMMAPLIPYFTYTAPDGSQDVKNVIELVTPSLMKRDGDNYIWACDMIVKESYSAEIFKNYPERFEFGLQVTNNLHRVETVDEELIQCYTKLLAMAMWEYHDSSVNTAVRLCPLDLPTTLFNFANVWTSGECPALKEHTSFIYDYRNETTSKDVTYFYEQGASGDDITYSTDASKFYLADTFHTMGEAFSKVKNIVIKESNRYNILQLLCETFQCWIKFNIQHNEDGRIISRSVQFKEYIGNTNYSGFVYGKNLKSTKRTIDSSVIATKLIVPNNNNQFGKNKICSIQRAPQNTSGLSFIYDFHYYLGDNNQQLFSDLTTLYSQVGPINQNLLAQNDIVVAKSTELIHLESSIRELELLRDQCQNAMAESVEFCIGAYSQTPQTIWDNRGASDSLYSNSAVKEAVDLWLLNNQKFKQLTDTNGELTRLSVRRNELKTQIDNIQTSIKVSTELVKTKVNLFEQKYTQFIREGVWKSDEFYDDSLYYFESLNIATTSSVPKVSYVFDAVDLSALPDYAHLTYACGDKTTVTDNEIFGQNADGSPKRQWVVITQTVQSLDDPTAYKVTIQNYTTQFDDLFRRIAASNQLIQSQSGNWQQAAEQFETTYQGTQVEPTVLETAFANNKMIIQNAAAASVVWDEYGITITDTQNTGKQLRLMGGALAMTEDGESWQTGMDASGINAALINAGTLNTDKIRIGNPKEPSFIWNKYGLNAVANRNLSEFIRFDKNGLYGIKLTNGKDINDYNPTKEEIFSKADFGITNERIWIRYGSGSYIPYSANPDTAGHDPVSHISNTIIGQSNDTFIYNAWDDQGRAIWDDDSPNSGFVPVYSTGNGGISQRLVIYDDGTIKARKIYLESPPTVTAYGASYGILYASSPIEKPNDDTRWSEYPESSATDWHKSQSANDVYCSETFNYGETWSKVSAIDARTIAATRTWYYAGEPGLTPTLITEWQESVPELNEGEVLYTRWAVQYQDGSLSTYSYNIGGTGSVGKQGEFFDIILNPTYESIAADSEGHVLDTSWSRNLEIQITKNGQIQPLRQLQQSLWNFSIVADSCFNVTDISYIDNTKAQITVSIKNASLVSDSNSVQITANEISGGMTTQRNFVLARVIGGATGSDGLSYTLGTTVAAIQFNASDSSFDTCTFTPYMNAQVLNSALLRFKIAHATGVYQLTDVTGSYTINLNSYKATLQRMSSVTCEMYVDGRKVQERQIYVTNISQESDDVTYYKVWPASDTNGPARPTQPLDEGWSTSVPTYTATQAVWYISGRHNKSNYYYTESYTWNDLPRIYAYANLVGSSASVWYFAKQNMKEDTFATDSSGKLYISATYLQSHIIEVLDSNQNRIFYANDGKYSGSGKDLGVEIGGFTVANSVMSATTSTGYVEIGTAKIALGSKGTDGHYTFEVTNDGKLYANDGIFRGSIQTNSLLMGGTVTDNGLTFSDSLIFKYESPTRPSSTLAISGDGLALSNNNILCGQIYARIAGDNTLFINGDESVYISVNAGDINPSIDIDQSRIAFDGPEVHGEATIVDTLAGLTGIENQVVFLVIN